MSNGSRSAFLLTSTATNVLFISVLIRFPVFLRHVKSEGADPVVVVRLATFYELNVGPFLLLIHRRRWPSRVTPNQPFWSDTLLMVSAVGQFISSLITAMLFFPRSLTRENCYLPRLASSTSVPQTRSHAYLSSKVAQSPTQMHQHTHGFRSPLQLPIRVWD